MGEAHTKLRQLLLLTVFLLQEIKVKKKKYWKNIVSRNQAKEYIQYAKYPTSKLRWRNLQGGRRDCQAIKHNKDHVRGLRYGRRRGGNCSVTQCECCYFEKGTSMGNISQG